MFRCFGKKSVACRLRQVKYLQVKRKSVIAAVVQVIVIVLGTGIICGKNFFTIECYVVHIYNIKNWNQKCDDNAKARDFSHN